jgi:hypothetical protein
VRNWARFKIVSMRGTSTPIILPMETMAKAPWGYPPRGSGTQALLPLTFS